MIESRAFAAANAKAHLAPFSIERRDIGDHDILIDIAFCGVCHSDVHQVRDEWGGSIFPMVPGHEIVGTVSKIGAKVTKFAVGDLAGVGCLVDSCQTCEPCKHHLEQFCVKGAAMTYNGTEMDRHTLTYGGYSSSIVVKEGFALTIKPGQNLAAVAPLLCAGITTYSPLRHWKVGKNSRVGVNGLGGLGHMAVKLAASMGANVTVFSTSLRKKEDAYRFGAQEFVVTSKKHALSSLQNQFDFILDTVSAPHDLNAYLSLLRLEGALVQVGVPPEAMSIHPMSLISGRRSFSGSLIGGIQETQEMLDYCAEHNIVADVETIDIQSINEAYERMIHSDVRYRFSIDMKTL